jgi:translation elongation factor EF-1beta
LSIDASYLVRLKPGTPVDELVKALNRVEGVQNVEVVSPKDEDDDD